jgi:protein-L-isoaspartate O-methyltransferase
MRPATRALLALPLVGVLWVPPTPSRGQAPAKPADPSEPGPTRAKIDALSPKTFIHYIPTPQEVVDRMLELADVRKGDGVYDLGRGDGRVVITADKRYGVKAVGIDLDPERVRESRENVRKAGVADLVTIRQGDILKADLGEATVITAYRSAKLLNSLQPQFAKLKPGTRIVLHDYFGKWLDFKRTVKVRPEVSLTLEERRQLEEIYKGDADTLKHVAELAAGREHDLYLHVVPLAKGEH